LNITVTILFFMLLAVTLSLVSVIMMVVFLLRTNKKLKKFVESFKLFCLSSWVDKRMKPDNEYENFEKFFQKYEKKDKKKPLSVYESYPSRIK
jgi:hypothetical protein